MPVSGLPPYDDTNIFARILRGEIPCSKVYEDDQVLAFQICVDFFAIGVVVRERRMNLRERQMPKPPRDLFRALAHIAQRGNAANGNPGTRDAGQPAAKLWSA